MENTNKFLILYHSEDNDGLISGAIIYNYLINDINTDANNITCIGAKYDDLEMMIETKMLNTFIETYTHIIITDLSFRENIMKKLYEIYGNRLTWIDHHKPIIEESYKYDFYKINGVRNINHSAIFNAYEYLYDQFNVEYKNGNIPELFRILSAWDSFSYEDEGYTLEYVKIINTAVTNYIEYDFKKAVRLVNNIIHNKFDNEFFNILYVIGSEKTDYDNKRYEQIVKTYGDVEWTVNGKSAIALFIQEQGNSTMFKSVESEYECGIVFTKLNNSNWKISIYNIRENTDFDCGLYMKEKYKGGGHKGAAGATVKESIFIKILKNKSL